MTHAAHTDGVHAGEDVLEQCHLTGSPTMFCWVNVVGWLTNAIYIGGWVNVPCYAAWLGSTRHSSCGGACR